MPDMKPALLLACSGTCLFVFGLSGLALFAAPGNEAASRSVLVYFGTYTGQKSQGIYVSRLDLATGQLSAPELAAAVASPSFVAIHPNRRFLYAVNEVSNFQGKKSGAVSAFVIEPASGK